MQPELVISLEGMQSNTCTAVQSVLRGEDPATLCPRPSFQAQIVAPMAKRGPPTPSQDSVRTVFFHTAEPQFIHRILPKTKTKKKTLQLSTCVAPRLAAHTETLGPACPTTLTPRQLTPRLPCVTPREPRDTCTNSLVRVLIAISGNPIRSPTYTIQIFYLILVVRKLRHTT